MSFGFMFASFRLVEDVYKSRFGLHIARNKKSHVPATALILPSAL